MFIFDPHQVKRLDDQRRQKAMARYEMLREIDKTEPVVPVADVIDMTFPNGCEHTEPLGA